MPKIIYKYPGINIRLSNITIKEEIKHGVNNPIKLYIIDINKISYILKIKDEKYTRWNVNKIHNNIEFTNNYKYVIKNLDKISLKYFYKILYSFQNNKKVYHIMEKYSSDLDYFFFDLKPSKRVLKNILVKIQCVLFNLNNKLHIYHNDIINGEKYLIRNIMYNKKRVHSLNKIKYYITPDISIYIYDDIYEPIIIDFDNSTKGKPYFKRINHFNKMFDNKIDYISEVIIFTYYYPGKISARLEKLRYTPRINPTTGNKMKLLSEEEEDAYLDEGQQAEENVFSVDYDVWIDQETGYTHIEKYKGHLNAHECDNCGFRTLRLVKEEVIEEATEFWDGSISQEFSCSYCGRVKRKTVALTFKVKENTSDTARLISNPLANNKEVEAVKIEIFSNKGDTKMFNFQNIEQAQKFLEEFDFEKIEDED